MTEREMEQRALCLRVLREHAAELGRNANQPDANPAALAMVCWQIGALVLEELGGSPPTYIPDSYAVHLLREAKARGAA
jgi:hypothetical protein